MKNLKLTALLIIATSGAFVNANAQNMQQPNNYNGYVQGNTQYGQPAYNGQTYNGQTHNGGTGQQANMAMPQIANLVGHDGTTWQAAPQYAQQPNVQAFITNINGQQLISQITFSGNQMRFVVYDFRSGQALSQGNGQILDPGHIRISYNQNGTMHTEMLYVNYMQNNGVQPSYNNTAYPSGQNNQSMPSGQQPYYPPPQTQYNPTVQPNYNYSTTTGSGHNNYTPSPNGSDYSSYNTPDNSYDYNTAFSDMLLDQERITVGDSTYVVPSDIGSSSWVNTDTGDIIDNSDALYDPNADTSVDVLDWVPLSED